MGGILLLLALCVVMALASFFAGVVPLSFTMSSAQLRLLSSVGVGILVGTSLIVIIPEGIETISSHASAQHSHGMRSLAERRWAPGLLPERRVVMDGAAVPERHRDWRRHAEEEGLDLARRLRELEEFARREEGKDGGDERHGDGDAAAGEDVPGDHDDHDDNDNGHDHGPDNDDDVDVDDDEHGTPTFYIGFSLVLGFALMFLIDRVPRHASDSLRSAPQTRHISLDDLGGDGSSVDEESDSFLGSLAPSPRQSRSLATTVGLVIHAAADGIAMGASSTTSDMKLGFIIFVAIMIHKAPAAFGLTSVLLTQGLSKRAARGHLIVFSLAAPAGALTTWLVITVLGGSNLDGERGQWWTGMLLLFSAGAFLYVAMHAMQEDGGSHGHHHPGGLNGYSEGSQAGQQKRQGPQMRDTMATIGGMLVPLLTQIGHHH